MLQAKFSTPRNVLFGKHAVLLCGIMFAVVLFGGTSYADSMFSFHGAMSETVLNAYLSRAVSHQLLFTDNDEALLADDIRMFHDEGAKFIGRASIIWETPPDVDAFFDQAASLAAQVHAVDPEIILQAGVFEIVDTGVDAVSVPTTTFEAFGLTPVERHFRYADMLYPDGTYWDYFGSGQSIPDMSRLETRLWFYTRARRYIDAGYEALHFGVVDTVEMNDAGNAALYDLLTRIREYAAQAARRGMILCDAHHPTGMSVEGKTVFDFLSYPMRIQETVGIPYEGHLSMDAEDVIYGRTLGGVTPSGWIAERLPYLVEIDNWGSSGQGGEDIGGIWVWGWDEIDWFARLASDKRDEFLRSAVSWLRTHDAYGHVQFPSRRILADPVADNVSWYFANRKSAACVNGFGQEDVIQRLMQPLSMVPVLLVIEEES